VSNPFYILSIDGDWEFEDVNLCPQNIGNFFTRYEVFRPVGKYAYPAMLDEIKGDKFNLNIPRFFDTIEPAPEVDISVMLKGIIALEDELPAAQKEPAWQLKELGL
jgi:type I restriction enzyme M protein